LHDGLILRRVLLLQHSILGLEERLVTAPVLPRAEDEKMAQSGTVVAAIWREEMGKKDGRGKEEKKKRRKEEKKKRKGGREEKRVRTEEP